MRTVSDYALAVIVDQDAKAAAAREAEESKSKRRPPRKPKVRVWRGWGVMDRAPSSMWFRESRREAEHLLSGVPGAELIRIVARCTVVAPKKARRR